MQSSTVGTDNVWSSIVGLLFFLAIIAYIAYLVTRHKQNERPRQPTDYVYSKKQYLMTKYERYFYRRLHRIFGKYYLIFPQIHLDDLLEHTQYGQNWKAALSKIQRKSVDYVICTTDFKILLAIELDDHTHRDPARQQRDRLVEYIFHQAGVQLVRFTEADKITDEEIYKTIMQAVHRSAEVEASYK